MAVSTRVGVFIDGFNVYHFLSRPEFRKYKWLNYKRLAECYLPRNSHIASIQYFTALANWDQDKVRRHNVYIRALRNVGIEIIGGRFKHVKRKVVISEPSASRIFKTIDGNIPGKIVYGYTFEEKKTDVNIACKILEKAALDEFDLAILISGDTDFEPIYDTLKNVFRKTIIVVVPNKSIAASIIGLVGASNCVSIKEKDSRRSLLDDPLTLSDGTILQCPNKWK